MQVSSCHNPCFSGNLFTIIRWCPHFEEGYGHNPCFSGNLFTIANKLFHQYAQNTVTILVLVETSLQSNSKKKWEYD